MAGFFIYNYNMELKDKKLYLLDMDGTIYLGSRLFDGTLEFLSFIKEKGGRYMFLTNNSSRGKDDYIKKMRLLGIETSPEDFLTSADAAAALLKEKYGKSYNGRKMYVMGTESLCSQLEAEGFWITRTADADTEILLAGFDRELTYRKLEDACMLLNRGVDYYATNPDWVCPTENGSIPDCGSMCQMLQHATGRAPYFIGKPRPDMALMAVKKTGFSKEETLIVGDRLYTDIACGNNACIDTCFVLSGEGTLDDLKKSQVKPTYVLNDIEELLRRIKDEA